MLEWANALLAEDGLLFPMLLIQFQGLTPRSSHPLNSPLPNPTVNQNLKINPTLIENSPSGPSIAPVVISTSYSKSRESSPPELLNQITIFHPSREVTPSEPPTLSPLPPHLNRLDVKFVVSSRSKSPPPILRSFLPIASNPSSLADLSYSSLVERVSSSLDNRDMEEDSEDSDDLLSKEDEEIPNEDDGATDSMTLVQYQEEVRRDDLIRKGSYTSKVSPKKDRVEAGGSHL